MKKPTILIITKSDDNESIEMVMEAVQAAGGRAFRFDTDKFPTETKMSLRYGKGGGACVIDDGSESLDLGAVTGVWYRRLHIAGRLPVDMEKQLRFASEQESRVTVLGMIAALDAFMLDPVWHVRHAENKQLQLDVADRLGLETPRSLTTNNPAAVREFAKSCPSGLITKMMASFAVYEGGQEQVVFTNKLSPEDLEDLEGLDLCPMTFQELVEKEVELRCTVVGNRVFTAAVDSKIVDNAKIDWRREGQSLLGAWKQYELPRDVADKLIGVCQHFGLNYGAADILVTPDNRFVFLEVNPVGEFFWLDRFAGLPISQAIGEVLVGNGETKRRPY